MSQLRCAHTLLYKKHLFTRCRLAGEHKLTMSLHQKQSLFRALSSSPQSGEELLDMLVNHERTGVPAGAGSDTKAGFDLVRLDALQQYFVI